jgi:dephospho-CoA kinase
MEKNMAEVIVVYVPETIQLERLRRRDGIGEQAAMARIRSQMPIEHKRRRATVVIDNSGSLADTRKQVMALFSHLNQIVKVNTEVV